MRYWSSRDGALHGASTVGVRILLVVLLALVGTTPSTVVATRRVLVVQSFGRGLEPYRTFSAMFQTDLARLSPQPVEFSEVSLPPVFEGGSSEERLVDYLEVLGGMQRFDLMVTLGAPASRFVQQHRARLLSSEPLLIVGHRAPPPGRDGPPRSPTRNMRNPL